ncbi:unnamed protein product [Owenia fusiformis]|uniref:Uncharacterized protein n=1 Tax=Owenia fusiformis TaxID=6347 RepID=A0A8J1UYH0_OWEFU|nr:unnamed protein product [Owenia fusiformis]
MSNPFAFLGLNIGSQAGGQMMPPGSMPPGGMPPGMAPIPPPQPRMMGHDPLQNNAPLQFNMNKGKPPMPVMGQSGEVMPNQDGDQRQHDDRGGGMAPQGNGGMGPGDGMGPGGGPGPNNMQSPDNNMMGHPGNNMMNQGMQGMGNNMMGSMMGGMPPVNGDPNQMIMMNAMGYNQFGGNMMPMPEPPREPIHFKTFTLLPPPQGAPRPSTRERPPGCRTIFVGGIPDNTTEDMIREMFCNCGEIYSIRLSTKNFAHIRFDSEDAVDKSLYLSGYRMQIENKTDKANSGRIHVDFAQARDDLYEWECQQRALMREQRHRQRVEEDRLRPPSPPPIIHFSDHEASILSEKLKGDETFMSATQALVAWLERGDCNKRNANTFYSMVQSVNSHIRRLLNEKQNQEAELIEIKEKHRNRMQGILRQFEQIDSVFITACKQKAWDHFSKAQRKNLDAWAKQAKETLKSQQENVFAERQDDDMELSDSENDAPATKKSKLGYDPNLVEVNRLRDENESLKCQIEAYKNEVELLKHDSKTDDQLKDKQMKSLQQALQGMQQQLISQKSEMKRDEEELKRLRIEMQMEKQAKKVEGSTSSSGDSSESDAVTKADSSLTSTTAMSDKEGRLIGLISTFLHVHPFGASVDYIWSFLNRVDITLRSSEIEDLLEKLPNVFRQDLHGVGASIEKRWKFVGFEG